MSTVPDPLLINQGVDNPEPLLSLGLGRQSRNTCADQCADGEPPLPAPMGPMVRLGWYRPEPQQFTQLTACRHGTGDVPPIQRCS